MGTDNSAAGMELRPVDRARQAIYQVLSAAFADPQRGGWDHLKDKGIQELGRAGADFLRAEFLARPLPLAPGELGIERLDLRRLVASLGRPRSRLVADYDQAFGLLTSQECPPYETEYCPQTFVVYRSHRLADIAGFYRAFGLVPSHDRPDRADHITLELEFMAWLIAKELFAGVNGFEEEARTCRQAQQKFLREHLAWWAPAFAVAIRRKTETDSVETDDGNGSINHLAEASLFLSAFIALERAILRVEPPDELLEPNAADEAPSEECGGCSTLVSLQPISVHSQE